MDEDEGMTCRRHGNPAEGICALCLQEKLTRLLSTGPAARPFEPPSPPSPPSTEPNPGPPSTHGPALGSTTTTRFLPFFLSRLAHSRNNNNNSNNKKKTKTRRTGKKGLWHWLRTPSSAVSDDKERLVRSRSVGCNGPSGGVSGALRRAESQRESRPAAGVRTRARGGWGLMALASPGRVKGGGLSWNEVSLTRRREREGE